MIKPCGCGKESKYQDEKYGAGVRVFTEGVSKVPGQQRGKCTVCGETKTFDTKKEGQS